MDQSPFGFQEKGGVRQRIRFDCGARFFVGSQFDQTVNF